MDVFMQRDILGLVKDHFSKATDSDGLIVWEDVKGYVFEDAKRAIEDHRREKGAMAYRPDPRRIKTLAATFHAERRRRSASQMKVVDWIRREDKQGIYPPDMPDAEVITAKFRADYDNLVASCEGTEGFPFGRLYIRDHAMRAMYEIGMKESEVLREAGWCVGLEPGERLPKLNCERGGTAQPFHSDEPPPPAQQAYESVRALKRADSSAPAFVGSSTVEQARG